MCRKVRFPCISCLVFNWGKRRYSWRASYYYYSLCSSLALGIAATFLLKSLMNNLSFFGNYVCTERHFQMILHNFIAMMTIAGIIGVFSFLMGRLTSMFSNYSLSDFMSLGKWVDRLGCVVKWSPWIIALTALAWLMLSIVNGFYIGVNPAAWCAERFALNGTVVVTNCRTWNKVSHNGCTTNTEKWNSNVYKCNDPEYLASEKWLNFGADNLSKCNIKQKDICNFATQFFQQGSSADWKNSAVEGCYGARHDSNNIDIHRFVLEDSRSDLYRYVLLYVILWSAGFIIACITFFGMKHVTPFDAAFHQAKDDGENIFYKILRPLTPWSG